MRTTEVEVILETYDEAINKRKAIIAVAKLFNLSTDEVIAVLKKNGRTIDMSKKEKPEKKETETKEPETAAVNTLESEKAEELPFKIEEQKTAKDLPIPDYVKDCLFDKFGQVETKLGELQQELEKTSKEYTLLKNFLFG